MKKCKGSIPLDCNPRRHLRRFDKTLHISISRKKDGLRDQMLLGEELSKQDLAEFTKSLVRHFSRKDLQELLKRGCKIHMGRP